MTSANKFGEVLLENKWISTEQWEQALAEVESTKAPLGSILVRHGWIKPDQLTQALAQQYRMRFVKLKETLVSRKAVEAVPLKVALHFKVMPVGLENSNLTVAIANPQDIRAVDGLRLALNQKYAITSVLATGEDILLALKREYGVGAETIDKILEERSREAGLNEVVEEAIEDIEQMAGDASVVKLVNQLILEVHTRRATDIHLEPYRGKVRMRYRIDGILHDIDVPPTFRKLFPAIISRVKVLSNLNLVERRLPQDGRASVKVGEQKLDLRVSTVPTSSGESVVIRILPSQMLLDLKDLGFRPDDLKIVESVLKKPHGLIFVTGPTGSGKTTTLYASLKTLNTAARKIITIEDPIEYEMEGASQIQVNTQVGLTFATGLRSMLRHDPDVMMVGEVRDLETAELSIRIALTGHMVLSTLHTNDASGGVTRLMDMGIDPYLIVSSVDCIIGQRLVRLLCPSCKQPLPSAAGQVGQCKAVGCEACQRTGFKGRGAIYEVFVMTPKIRELILQKASSDALRKAAVEGGMQTMRENGLEKVRMGMTTMDEILRVAKEED